MKTTKNFLSIILALIMIISIIPMSTITVNAATPKLTVSADKTNVKVGDVVTVTVKLAEKSGLGALTFDVTYDATAFKAVEMASGDLGAVVNANFAAGKARATLSTATSLENAGTVCTVKLEAIKATDSRVTIAVVEACDGNFNSLNVDVNGIVIYGVCADGHTWSKWNTIKESSCYYYGCKERFCSLCGTIEKQDLPLISHSYDFIVTPPTCTEKGYTTYTCSVCLDSYVSDYLDVIPHVYTWYTISVVTCETDGVMLGECSVCEDIEINATPKTGHDIIDSVCQNCGYTENAGNEDDNNDIENEDNNATDEPSDDCSCNCHKSGISKFFFDIGLFFQKIFGSNKTCACGVAHY